jgi:hypothetical protein
MSTKRRAEAAVLLPAGPKIAFTGGLDFKDHQAIWARLDKVRERHPDMVLLHGGSPKGAERIAACWADNRKVPQIAFKPDWTRHGKAAPFKRNDQLLAVLPRGVPRLRHLRESRRLDRPRESVSPALGQELPGPKLAMAKPLGFARATPRRSASVW